MPWTCTICGRKGDREGVVSNERLCYRTGVATMKGYLLCCNCMRATGWEGYAENGCRNCHRLAKANLPEGSERKEQVEQLVRAAFATLPKNPMPAPLNDVGPQSGATPTCLAFRKLVVFEFDDVLFRTPRRPRWWPFSGYHCMIESMLPPLVPAELASGAEWFNEDVIKEAKEAWQDPNTWSVLVTFRGDAFRDRILEVLTAQGVQFNETRFRACPCLSPLGATQHAQAGYGGLQPHLRIRPCDPQDKHMLSTVGSILTRVAFAWTPHSGVTYNAYVHGQEIDVWVCGNKHNDRASKLRSLLRSSERCSVAVRAVECRRHDCGVPTFDELVTLRGLATCRTKIQTLSGSRVMSARSSPCRFRSRVVMTPIPEPRMRHAPLQRASTSKPQASAAPIALWPSEVYSCNRNWKGGKAHLRGSKFNWHRDACADNAWLERDEDEDEELEEEEEEDPDSVQGTGEEQRLDDNWVSAGEDHLFDDAVLWGNEVMRWREYLADGLAYPRLNEADCEADCGGADSDQSLLSLDEAMSVGSSMAGVISIASDWMADEDDVLSLSSFTTGVSDPQASILSCADESEDARSVMELGVEGYAEENWAEEEEEKEEEKEEEAERSVQCSADARGKHMRGRPVDSQQERIDNECQPTLSPFLQALLAPSQLPPPQLPVADQQTRPNAWPRLRTREIRSALGEEQSRAERQVGAEKKAYHYKHQHRRCATILQKHLARHTTVRWLNDDEFRYVYWGHSEERSEERRIKAHRQFRAQQCTAVASAALRRRRGRALLRPVE